MGVFDLFKSGSRKNPIRMTLKMTSDQFVTEEELQHNSSKQAKMTPLTLNQLAEYGVTAEKELKIEFFFYSNSLDKVAKLSNALMQLNYTVQFRQSEGHKNLFIATGWTTTMKMDNNTVISWTKKMCELGYQFDCDFDGWGTTPDQE